MSNKANKVVVSGSIDPDVFEALEAYCRDDPRRSKSAVMTRALRQLLFPEHQEERERVLTENLDRVYWRQRNSADRTSRELRIIREMLALLVRTFYNHTPEVPQSQREAAAVSGEARFNRFLAALDERVGSGKSVLERMPEEAVVTVEDAVAPDESDDGEEKIDASRN